MFAMTQDATHSLMSSAKRRNGDGAAFNGLRNMRDGTSDKENMKAMTTYLNRTGAADYNLPKMTGERIMLAGK